MKKFLKILIILLLSAIVILAVALGAFYKNASPTLIVDLSKKAESTASVSVIEPKYKTEQEILENQNEVSSPWWISKWYGEMLDNFRKTYHYDFTDCDFKTYIKKLSKRDFDGFEGVASIDDSDGRIDVLCLKGKKKSSVVFYGLGKTELAGKMLEIKIEEALYKGDGSDASLPVILRDYTASASDKLEVELDKLNEDSVYHIKITEADKTSAPAYENENPPVSYTPDGELSADVNVKEDGVYTLDFVYEKAQNDAEIELYCDGEAIRSATLKASEITACSGVEVELKKGTHKLQIKSDDSLSKIRKMIVALKDDSVYIVENVNEKGYQKYTVVSASDCEYSVTSTDLTSGLTVNSEEISVNELGGAIVKLRRGFNEIQYKSDSKSEINITEYEE